MSKKTIHMILSADAAGGQITDPRDHLAGDGAGGSRAGYCGLVRAMGRRRDYDVTAFSTWKDPKDEFEGVTYQRLDDRRGFGEADVVFAYYDVRPLLGVKYDPERLRVASHHTLHPYVAWRSIDLHTAPSRWAADFLRSVHRPLDPWEVLPNAVEGLDAVEWRPVAGRVIYQTSPDRGLHHLLALWPNIKKRVPHATLHVTGTPGRMADAHSGEEWRGSAEARMAQMLADGMLAAQVAGGCEFIGRVSRPRMLLELSEASCFAFPSELFCPSETFSVSILEAERIGVPVVLAPSDALRSVWGESGCIVTADPAREHLREFEDAVVDVLTRPEIGETVSRRQKEFSAQFTFDAAAAALHAMIVKHGSPA